MSALSPIGAVRRQYVGAGERDDDLFRRLGVGARRCDLGDAGLYLAEELVKWNDWLGPRERQAFAVGVLALLLAERQGSTRLPLDARGPGAELCAAVIRAAGLDGELEARRVLKILRELGTGGFHDVVGPPPRGEQACPLVFDDDCLYPHRLWWLETRLAARLAPRLGRTIGEPAAVAAAVAAIRDVRISDEQAAAVAAALGHALAVITGGPGTGKTATLAAIVAALAHLGVGADAVALAAPTGKAAFRMGESLRARAAGGPQASTIHRLLGYQPGGGFHHGDGNPLPFCAVIVDEASMIDLALMERLCAALAPDTRLVLLGDPDQLPSVEAGQVLTDLIASAGGAPWTARLTRSFRVDTEDAGGRAILTAAAAVLAGDARRLTTGRDRVATPRASAAHVTGRGVELVEADPTAALAYVDAWWARRWQVLGELARRAYHRTADGAWAGSDEEALAALLAAHEASRLLAVTRSGPLGAIAIGQRCHDRVLAEATVDGAPDFLPGDPVVHTRNDYARGLWNGDQGVIARVVDADGVQHYRAVFRRPLPEHRRRDDDPRRDELVPFPIDALRGGLELGWAMTVHKSQGSELGQVTLILPPEDLPLVSRELVYTALTRARTSAVVVGAPRLLADGGARRAVRSTGLATRLARR